MTTSHTSRSVSRRTALAGLGAGALGLAIAPALGAAGRANAQEATPTPLQNDSSVPYGPSDAHDGLLPAVILIHGGAMAFGSRFDDPMPAMATAIAAAGYVAVNVDYRLFVPDDGANPWPAQLDDVQRVVRWLRANAATYGVDPDRIGALGHSAGGQLAAFLGTRDTRDNGDAALADFSSRVSCVVDLAGSVDSSVPLPDADLNALIAALLGGTADNPPSPAVYRDFSPITFVDQTSAPFLILQGEADPLVPIEQSRRMADTLREAGVEVNFGAFPGLDHFSLLDWSVIGAQIVTFLDRHLQAGR